MFFMSTNRVGNEGGFRFIGQSKICDPNGKILAQLNDQQEGINYAEIDPQLARNKQIVRVPGKLEVNYIKDRRPSHYTILVKSEDSP